MSDRVEAAELLSSKVGLTPEDSVAGSYNQVVAPVIFALDDAEADRMALQRALRRIDPEIRLRQFDSEESLQAELERIVPGSRDDQPVFVLLDMNLHPEDGLTVLDHLRRAYPGLPIVMLSGSARPEDVDAAYHRGAMGFVVKPMGIAELVAVMEPVVRYWCEATSRPTRLDP